MTANNKKVYLATCLALGCQALVLCLPPLMFVTFNQTYGISFTELGLLTLIGFIIELIMDISMTKLADKIPTKLLGFLCFLTVGLGMVLYVVLPLCFSHIAYICMIIATIIANLGAGALESFVSPLVIAVSEGDSKLMNLAHGFFAWGEVIIVIITSIVFLLFGTSAWYYVMGGFALIPIGCIVYWICIDVPDIRAKGTEKSSKKDVLCTGYFIMCMVAIFAGGAAENVLSQWTSTYMEEGLGLPKLYGDLVGVLSFASMMALGRTFLSKTFKRDRLPHTMCLCAVCAIVGYLILCFTSGYVSCIGCAIAGLGISVMWPTTLVIASDRFPKVGMWMFAFMAIGGDIGCSISPYITGALTDIVADSGISIFGISGTSLGLRAGMAVGLVFAIIFLFANLYLSKKSHKGLIHED